MKVILNGSKITGSGSRDFQAIPSRRADFAHGSFSDVHFADRPVAEHTFPDRNFATHVTDVCVHNGFIIISTLINIHS